MKFIFHRNEYEEYVLSKTRGEAVSDVILESNFYVFLA